VTQTILVPSTAAVERGELTSLFVVGEDRIARLRWVKLGRRFDKHVEILSGIHEGERVLTDGSQGVDGAAVQVVETVAAPK
jgi:multidrug efflux pump subunit AcrA (membrane-fusion protein)